MYVFRCVACGAGQEELRRIGDTAAPPCDTCGGETRLRFGRVAVKYGSFGFTATDRLVSDPTGRKDFRTLRESAERIADE
jgi:putative FmdB family regulatory protein